MAKIIYQIQIELLRSRPGIWRRLLVPSEMLLSDLHKVIQTTMGWTNSHLHQFIKDRTFYTERIPDDDLWDEMNNVDYKKMKISDLLLKENDTIVYEYDFGDGWEHEIVLERILSAEENTFYPVCIGGRKKCPPEDCGGIPGYINMLSILDQPDHEEYESYITWLGGKFDPENFNVEFVNTLLQRKKFGLPDPTDDDQILQYSGEYEGYSTNEMQNILSHTFEEDSLVKLQTLSEEDYKKIPLFNQIKILANLIAESQELKLTKKGFLPVKAVAELYSRGIMKDEYIERKISRLYKETDSHTIYLPRIILEISGLTKKRNNKISLTKKGESIIKDDSKFLRLILEIYTTKFNWSAFDGYGENDIGQTGFGFSLILLNKFGKESHEDIFYAKKYFKAFPMLAIHPILPVADIIDKHSRRCYSVRTFERFLEYFGLITIDQEKGWDKPQYITRTDLFDKLFKIMPPGGNL